MELAASIAPEMIAAFKAMHTALLTANVHTGQIGKQAASILKTIEYRQIEAQVIAESQAAEEADSRLAGGGF